MDIEFGDWVFAYCESMKEFTFPEGVTDTGNYTFYDCLSLERVDLPDTLKTLGRIFAVCPAVKEVSIPASVTTIHSTAFTGCKLIEVLNFEGTMAHWNKIYKGKSSGSKWNSGSYIKIVCCIDGDIEITE